MNIFRALIAPKHAYYFFSVSKPHLFEYTWQLLKEVNEFSSYRVHASVRQVGETVIKY